ncbi:MAG: bifunctional tetrahydrofolate synthase/dihydrofolate synthase [Gammaproteobacteria bacterium]|nr:bifunctional tetrahydrofolate synthase/dihydrofolate synthase [Gammaproteobacteria bacterium]
MPTVSEGPALSAWLRRIEALHPTEIELGLSRVEQVARAAGLERPHCPLITVAGTNGKGSAVAFLTAIFSAAGYKVGAYTSPHIRVFNERIRIDGQCVEDASIVAALDHLETLRGDISLTYFEYSTLAAMQVFQRAATDVVILEVGLGGRLDAVNIWDADVAVVTTIALDHESWLGNSREQIAVEKVGISRKDRPLVIGDRSPPSSLFAEAARIGAQIYCIQKDFDYSQQGGLWKVQAAHKVFAELPYPALDGQWQFDNAALAIVAASLLTTRLPLQDRHYRQAMRSVAIQARYQRGHFRGHPVILDVGHNPAAVNVLTGQLQRDFPAGVVAVFAVMRDKAVDEMITCIAPLVRAWYLGELSLERALGIAELERKIQQADAGARVCLRDSVLSALEAATEENASDLPIVVFGSFYTIAEVMEFID